MLLNHNSMQINKLYLTGDRVSKQQCLTQLNKQAWMPAHTKRWYFIHAIQLDTTLHKLPADLNRTTQYLLQHAVHVSSKYSHNQNCIYFNSLLELLIYLSIDISRNVTEKKWYWQQWNKGKTSQYSRLVSNWLEHIAFLPAIIYGLYQRKFLLPVWSMLEKHELDALYYSFAQHCGIDYGVFDNAFSSACSEVKNTLATSRTERSASLYPTQTSSDNTYLKDLPDPQWQAIAQTIELQPLLDNTPGSSAARLLCLLILNQSKPVILSSRPDQIQSEVHTLVKALTQLDAVQPDNKNIEAVTTEHHSLTKPDNSRFNQYQPGDQPAPAEDKQYPTHKSVVNIKARVLTTNRPIDEYTLISDYGGLFYLVNILGHQDIFPVFKSSPLLRQKFAGYKLLFQLGQLLLSEDSAAQHPPAYDPATIRLFKKLCHCKKQSELSEPDMTQLNRKIMQQIQNMPQLDGLITGQLIHRKASITLTQSHLDIYFSRADIDINIRLAGLDINPGWSAWLGRVISFHYQEDTG